MFVSGTGLEVMIENMGLDYDAQILRDYFFHKYHVRETI